VLLEMWDVLQEGDFVTERDVIEEHEMLVHLAHIHNMGNDGKVEELRHEADSQEFADSRNPSAVHLNERERFGLEDVLKKDSV